MTLVVGEDRTLKEAQAGDPAAFDALVSPLLDPAYRLAMVLLRDHAEAEDAVQEAALKAWSRLAQLRGDRTRLRSWFLAVVANECRMARRRPWWSVLRQREVADDRSSPEERAVRDLDLQRAIERLPADDRLALFSYFYLDLPLDEAAQVMGVPLGTAKSRIYRAARRLRPDVALEEVIDR
ncbi:MAG TPA: sigma-70 family RNA polymerase sigma factor [Candidatus Dormibacteraeota bacterium]